MKRIALFLLTTLILPTITTHAQEADKTAKAQEAAKMWLAVVDGGDYARSWEQASSAFKAAVTVQKWQSAVQAARSPLGKVEARKLKSAKFTRSLPGAPDGEYVVIQYDTRFEHKASALETVTPALEADGSWKVSGYFVK